MGESIEGVLDGKFVSSDSGEAFTIADSRGEAWVLNMLGGVIGIVQPAAGPPRSVKDHVVPTLPLPWRWDFKTKTWVDWGTKPLHTIVVDQYSERFGWGSKVALAVSCLSMSHLFAFVFGQCRMQNPPHEYKVHFTTVRSLCQTCWIWNPL